jgi:hypothetical protein
LREFLERPTDHITLHKTHSLRWLAQIVCQIIEAIEWEAEFKCEGISSLAEFRALIAELDAMDPVFCAIHSDNPSRRQGIPDPLRKSNVLKFTLSSMRCSGCSGRPLMCLPQPGIC